MESKRPVGLLAGLLKAAEADDLTDLATFTPPEVAPKLLPHLSIDPSLRQLGQALWYAKRKGLLATQDREGKLAVVLTYKGRERLLRLRRLDLAVKKPPHWDGKWRLVTFDIPERRRYARDTLRGALKRLGFLKLESSLWIYPFDCRQELATIKEALLLEAYVWMFVVESFDGEEKFTKQFGLTKESSQTETPG